MTLDRSSHFRLLAVVSVLVWLAACARVPIETKIRPDIHSAQDLRARLLARAQAIQSFEAKGRVTYISPDQKYNGTANFLGSKPQTLRVDVLNFWGQSALSIHTDGDELQILDYRQGKLFRGPVTTRNLAAFIPPVKISELLEVLTGSVVLSPQGPAQMTYMAEQDQYRLDLSNQDRPGHTVLWVDAQNLQIMAGEWSDAQKQLLFKVKFQDYQPEGRYTLPHQIILTTGDNKRQLRLHYRELTVNPQVTSEALTLMVPAQVQQVPFPP
ncbi:MAG: DUF4292 domain-containing protein [Deltaproteobacteria bacterium]|nr:DUF4292 domain-containing protein [Deltaproteobacteria bacterium]MBW1986291.1 DUF4292 domain-containing protein [Deltaproteobacteria bacterium]MBW2134332.1 DUF4292 domain-containing protein [Deltaproteobacteria bacterium]